jgi:SAM-dependent methyltransferase
MDPDRILSTNRNAWNHVAPLFYACTALPEYGPLAPTEDELQLLGRLDGVRVLELGCGSGHSLRHLADRGASEVWGVDLSPVQLNYARATLSGVRSSVRLIESAMERDVGVPANHFDLVLSIYGNRLDDGPRRHDASCREIAEAGRSLRHEWRTPRVPLPGLERCAVHDRRVVLF